MAETKKSGAKKSAVAKVTAKSTAKKKPAPAPVAKKKAAGVAPKAGAAKKTAVVAKPPKAKRAPAAPPPPPADANSRRRDAARKLAIQIAIAALDKKAERVEIVDIGEKVDYADFLVVMTGRSDRQVVAIARGIEEAVAKSGGKTHGREGLPQGHWVLIDFSDVIVHVFLDEARKYYDLEGLWLDAPRVPTPAFLPPKPTSSFED
ncbi:MAG: ribosome silencing factor [Deltaproteobacteria bacterium]